MWVCSSRRLVDDLFEVDASLRAGCFKYPNNRETVTLDMSLRKCRITVKARYSRTTKPSRSVTWNRATSHKLLLKISSGRSVPL